MKLPPFKVLVSKIRTDYALIFCAIILPLIFSFQKLYRRPEFHRNLLNGSYFSQTPSLSTDFKVSKTKASINVSRGQSSIEMTLPLENASLKKVGSKLIYSIPNIDISYQLIDKGLKEDIVLHQIPTTPILYSSINLKNLAVKMTPEGIPVFFNQKDSYQFHFQRPFAIDSAGNITYDLKYHLLDKSNNTDNQFIEKDNNIYKQTLLGTALPLPGKQYTLAVEINPDWLNDPNRSLPITIDPTIVHDTQTEFTSGTFLNTSDNGSFENSPNVGLNPQPVDLSDPALVGLYHLEDDNITDSTANQNHGSDASSSQVDGIFDKARYYNGSSTYSTIPDVTVNDFTFNQDFTVSFWVLSPGTTDAFADSSILEKWAGSGGYPYSFKYVKATRIIQFNRSDGTNAPSCVSSIPIKANTWHHIAGVRKSGRMYLYIDHQLSCSVLDTTTGTTTNASTLNIARRGDSTEYFVGGVDELAIFSRGLSAQEIENLHSRYIGFYQSPLIDLSLVESWNYLSWTGTGGATSGEILDLGSTQGLIAQWNFNQNTGTTILPSAGSCQNDCTLSFSSTPGYVEPDVGILTEWTAINSLWGGGSVMFDGANDSLSTGSTAFNFSHMTPFSVSLWFKSVGTTGTLISKQSDSSPFSGFSASIINSKSLRVELNGTVAGSSLSQTFNNLTVTDGRWHHLAFTYDGTMASPALKVYYDGTYQTEPSSSNNSLIGSIYTSTNLTIGSLSGTDSYFKGIIDTVLIFNRVLDSGEVKKLSHNGSVNFQTRSGDSSNPDDGTWSSWTSAVGSTQLLSLDNDSTNWSVNPNPALPPSSLQISDNQTTNPSPPSGCLDGQPFIVTNNLGTTQSSNIVPLRLAYKSGMSSDFSDVRFTLGNGSTLAYYLDTYSSSSWADFLISMPAPTSNTSYIYQWNNGCNDSNTSSATRSFPIFAHGFDGVTIDTSLFDYAGGTFAQNNEMDLVNNTSAWDQNIYTDLTYTRTEGLTFQAKFKANSSARGMIGWHDNSTGASYTNLVYGLYFNNGTFEIYEDGTLRRSAGTYTAGSFYDVKIRLKSTGADYYYKLSTSPIWINIYSSVYSSESNLRPAHSHNTATYHTISDDWYLYNDPGYSIYPSPNNSIKKEGNSSLSINQGQTKNDYHTLALWNFDETTSGSVGTTILDSSLHNYHAISPSTSPTIVDGISGLGRQFDGTQYYSIGDTSFDPKVFTIQAWIYINAFSANNQVIISKIHNIAPNLYKNFEFRVNSDGKLQAHIPNGSAWTEVVGVDIIPPKTWTHVALTYNGATAYIYVNGKYNGSVASVYSSSTVSTFIGARPENVTAGTIASYFNGIIDELKISDIPLTNDQIAQNYQSGTASKLSRTISTQNLTDQNYLSYQVASDHLGPIHRLYFGESAFANYQPDANTIGLWHLDEMYGSGAYLLDSSGNNYHATPTLTNYTPGIISGSRFSANDSNYICATVTNLPSGANPRTLSAWFYPTSNNNITVGSIFGYPYNNYPASTNRWFEVKYSDAGDNKFGLHLYGTHYYSRNEYSPNNWYHIAATYDGSIVRLYINGILEIYEEVALNTITNPTGCNFNIYGEINKTTDALRSGIIDEVRVDNVARSATEIRQAYESGLNTHTAVSIFKAHPDASGIGITASAFNIDETRFGSNQKANHLFVGDSIIIRETVNTTQYIAQGTVASVNASTGAVTIASWDFGSSFPPSGFSEYAEIFKWQQETVDIHRLPTYLRDSITNITIQPLNRNQPFQSWVDNLSVHQGYLNDSFQSSITSPDHHRYFQYRALLNHNTTFDTPSLSEVSISYVANLGPSTPVITTHDFLKTVDTTPIVSFYSNDQDEVTDSLHYEIQWSTDSTFTSSTTKTSNADPGFSNLTNPSDTAPFDVGSTIAYTFQSPLSNNTTYFYRLRTFDDHTYSNWSDAQSFTIDTSVVTDRWFQTLAQQFEQNTNSVGVEVDNANHYVYVSSTAPSIEGFMHNRSITIGNTGPELTNYDVLIDIDTTSLISAGKMQADCDDIRFIDSDGGTDLAYWIEGGCNSNHTQIWVRIPSIPNGGKTISFQYYNPTVENSEIGWTGNFTVMSNSSCSSNWTRNTDFDDRFPMGSDTYGNTGGSTSHIHNNTSCTTGGSVPTTRCDTNIDETPTTVYRSTHTHTAQVGVTDATNIPPFYEMIFCKSNEISNLSTNHIPIFIDSPPSGWTIFSEINNMFPLGSLSSGTTGGSTSHNHSTLGGFTTTDLSASTVQCRYEDSTGTASTWTHNHTTQDGTTLSTDHTPPYLSVIYASSNTNPNFFPSGAIALSDSIPPLGWTRYSQFDNNFPMGSSTAGITGGSPTHLHETTITTNYGGVSSYKYSSGGSWIASATSHYHSCTTNTPSASSLPPYLTTLFVQKNSPVTPITIGEESSNSDPSVATLSPVINAQKILPSATTWGQLSFTDNETHGDIKYQIYYSNNGSPTIVPNSVLPGNSSGFDSSPVNLSALSVANYPNIYVRAKLTYSGGSPTLSDWTVSLQIKPETPSITSPPNASSNVSLYPSFNISSTDFESDYLRYKIELCQNSSMTLACLTFDQTTSQVGWSGQNSQSSTAYNSASPAFYTIQNQLNPSTTYYWRAYAIDPAGSNTWSNTNSPPLTLTTATPPNTPGSCVIRQSPTDSFLQTQWSDLATDETNYYLYKSIDNAGFTLLQTLPANTTNYTDNDSSSSHTYRYQLKASKTTNYGPDIYSGTCHFSPGLNLGIGNFLLDGLRLNGLKLD